MPTHHPHDKKKKDLHEEDQGGESSQSGSAGEIPFQFKDPLSVVSRDDLLPPHEIKRLLRVEQELHRTFVQKQKNTRRERELLKESRQTVASRYETGIRSRLGKGSGYAASSSPYKKHPISDKFSGIIDRKVTPIVSENNAKTNPEMRNELRNRNELRHQPVPRFNPKPRPR